MQTPPINQHKIQQTCLTLYPAVLQKKVLNKPEDKI